MTKRRMLRTDKCACIGFFVSFLFIVHIHAQQAPTVYFSEIAWAGSNVSTADEWVELANAQDIHVDISGWTITRLSDGEEKVMVVIESGRIPPHGNFLLANYAPPGTVLPQTGDSITTGISLANTKLQLRLYDSNKILLDTADDGVGAPLAGSNTLKASMERTVPVSDGTKKDSWVTSTVLIDPAGSEKGYGTPKIAGYPHLTLDKNLLYYTFGKEITIQGNIVSPLYASDELSLDVVCGSESASVFKNTDNTFSANVSVPKNVSQCTATLTDPRMVSTSDILQLIELPPSGMIIISEVMPDPDAGEEWIELHNQGTRDVDLGDWQLDDILGSGSKSYIFPHQVIAAGEFITLFKSTTGIGLNNDGDEIHLIDPLGSVADSTLFESVPANQSWVRLSERSFAWSGFQTQSKANELPERINYYGLLTINEVLPNPDGSDEEGEWVEIVSHATEPIDINGWSLDDGDGGSSSFTCVVQTIIKPNQLYVITRPVSNVAFNNTSDSVRLFAPDTSLVESISYTGAVEGESYAYFDDGWQWTNHLTQGEINMRRKDVRAVDQPVDQPITQNLLTPSEPEIIQISIDSDIITDLPLDTVTRFDLTQKVDSPIVATLDSHNSDAVQTVPIKPDDGYILGVQSTRNRSLPLLIALFSAILLSVILGVTNIWHTIQLRQKKPSKTTPDSMHPG